MATSGVDFRTRDGRVARITHRLSKHTITAAFVAVVALAFHLTGSTSSTAIANQSVLVLATLIAQISLPHRQLSTVLRESSIRRHFERPRYDRRAVARPAQLTHMLSETSRFQ
jgi:hypothetical protein